MLEHLTDFISDQLVRHLMTSIAPRKERRRVIKEFVLGCVVRIDERIHDLCKQSEAVRTSNGRELVLIKSAAIDAKIKELDLHFRSSNVGCGANFDSAAFEAGRAAGNAATFGRPMSGTAGVLRIGSPPRPEPDTLTAGIPPIVHCPPERAQNQRGVRYGPGYSTSGRSAPRKLHRVSVVCECGAENALMLNRRQLKNIFR
jgi:hypothetical protein